MNCATGMIIYFSCVFLHYLSMLLTQTILANQVNVDWLNKISTTDCRLRRTKLHTVGQFWVFCSKQQITTIWHAFLRLYYCLIDHWKMYVLIELNFVHASYFCACKSSFQANIASLKIHNLHKKAVCSENVKWCCDIAAG